MKVELQNLTKVFPSRNKKENSEVIAVNNFTFEIPDGKLLWYSDEATWTIKSKDGILEQIGRMLVQDHHEPSHCVYITNLAIVALKNGCTCREIEKAIRKIRMTLKESNQIPNNTELINIAGQAVTDLHRMGER